MELFEISEAVTTKQANADTRHQSAQSTDNATFDTPLGTQRTHSPAPYDGSSPRTTQIRQELTEIFEISEAVTNQANDNSRISDRSVGIYLDNSRIEQTRQWDTLDLETSMDDNNNNNDTNNNVEPLRK